MNISSIISTDGIIEAAFDLPAMKIKPRSAKRPSIDTAMKCVVDVIEDMVIAHYAGEVLPVIQDLYDTYILINGERIDSLTPDDWDSGMDDEIEAALEPYNENLSADWLARNTIGSALHEDKEIEKFADSFGKEYYTSLVHDSEGRKQKSPAQIMSSAGITKADVEAALEIHNNPTEKEKEDMADTDNNELQAVIDKMAEHLGTDYNELEIYDDLDLVSDEDDGLAFGAGARMGLDEEDVRVLQSERMVHGTDTPDMLHRLLDAALTAGAKPAKGKGKAKKEAPAKAAPAPKEKPAKAAPKAKPIAQVKKEIEDAAAEAEGDAPVIDYEVLEALKYCGGNDTTLSTGMGVSRATYNNWANGKTEFNLTEKQQTVLRDEIVERANKLLEALAKIDGTEAEVVF